MRQLGIGKDPVQAVCALSRAGKRVLRHRRSVYILG